VANGQRVKVFSLVSTLSHSPLAALRWILAFPDEIERKENCKDVKINEEVCPSMRCADKKMRDREMRNPIFLSRIFLPGDAPLICSKTDRGRTGACCL
jgi:hypothetical protein